MHTQFNYNELRVSKRISIYILIALYNEIKSNVKTLNDI